MKSKLELFCATRIASHRMPKRRTNKHRPVNILRNRFASFAGAMALGGDNLGLCGHEGQSQLMLLGAGIVFLISTSNRGAQSLRELSGRRLRS
ncbi:MAG: hypothetical protein QOH31_4262 [Verrucomicrobiota bacterium]